MSNRVRRAVRVGRQRLLLGSLRFSRFLRVDTARALLSELAASAPADAGGRRQLLVDVSVIARRDSGTGIQRTVRELTRQIIAHPPRDCVVRPVYATRLRGYRYAEQYRARVAGPGREAGPTGAVKVRAGDVFLGVDLSAHLLPRHPVQLGKWKAAGVKFHFVVYDLLPVLHPEWFNERTVTAYRRWLKTVAIHADGLVCISRSVAEELKEWLARACGNVVSRSIETSWFHLGGDISTSTGETKQPEKVAATLARMRQHTSVLMVGTLEPRKGHAQALSAMEILWRAGDDAHLVIVGKAGWKVDTLLARLRNHPEAGGRLIWLEDADDGTLCALYCAVNGVLVASEGEGFGLPIVEAARYGKPVLARDIPVFREIAGDRASYFSGNSPDALASAMQAWLDLVRMGQAPSSTQIGRLTWSESAGELLRCVLRR